MHEQHVLVGSVAISVQVRSGLPDVERHRVVAERHGTGRGKPSMTDENDGHTQAAQVPELAARKVEDVQHQITEVPVSVQIGPLVPFGDREGRMEAPGLRWIQRVHGQV
jgi:hypothetical protein